MKSLFENFISRIENQEIVKIWHEHPGVKKKFFDFFYNDISKIEKPKVIEFGVRHGISTSLFLDVCNMNGGEMYSIDENDYSYKFKSKNWNFIKSRDDNFQYLRTKIPQKADVIFLDTLHKADHVIKILIEYFKNLEIGGYFIIDDVSWIPYLKNNQHNHFYKEINNKETFESLLQIYSLNSDTISLKFNLIDTGAVVITKLKNKDLLFNNKKISRDTSFKNYLRLIYKKIFS